MKSVTLPPNYATLGYGPQGAIPSDGLVDYCPGPSTVNTGWNLRQQFEDRWIFWQPSGGGVRGSIWVPGFETSDTAGQVFPEFLVGETVSHLTACFDATGVPVIATDTGDGTVRLQTVNNGVLVEYTFAGSSPRLVGLAGLTWQDIDLLIAIYYVGLDGSIKARYQLNEFDTEVTICTPNTPVKALTKVDILDRRICLWAVGDHTARRLTRQVLFRTGVYPPIPVITQDTGIVSVFPQGDIALSGIQDSGTFSESTTMGVSPQGAVLDTVITVTITPEAATLAVEPQGSVVSVIQDSGLFSDSGTLAVSPQCGVVSVIETVPPIAETATLSISPQGAIATE